MLHLLQWGIGDQVSKGLMLVEWFPNPSNFRVPVRDSLLKDRPIPEMCLIVMGAFIIWGIESEGP